MGYHGSFGSKVGKEKYLLDMMPFASSAYSIRRITDTWLTDYHCMIVRRESDNQEISIGFKNDILDLNEIKGFCGSSVGRVVKWFDQSFYLRGDGVDRDATCASDILQPYIYSGTDFYYDDYGVPRIFFSLSNNEIRAYQFASVSNRFAFSTVSAVINPIGDNRNGVATDGTGVNNGGLYHQRNACVFNNTGVNNSFSTLPLLVPVSRRNFVVSLDYYTSTQAKIGLNENESPLSAASNYSTGVRGFWMLGSYYVGGTRSTTVSLDGFISEHISFNNEVDINMVRLNQTLFFTR